VTTALGLLGIVLFIVGVIGLAATVTWTVVRLTPSHSKARKQEPA
jgi:hypothetical protein